MKKIAFLVLAIFFCTALTASAEMSARIKDISKVKGVRNNQLVGYGLVTGLTGTGDSTSNDFTMQMVANMLKNFGLSTDINSMKTKNVAAVMVTANLPPFAQNGDTIDVQVSSIGDAKSLQGGTLLFTPLKAANGQVYAVAQGPLSLGGFSVSKNKNSVQKNHVTVGRIPNGATVEQSVPNDFLVGNTVTFVLNKPDFTTASRMVSKINSRMGGIAEAVDGSSVLVRVPPN
ncbi:MAG: flagellar basal body P-ring protein FlgI, partial [bacterium]